MKRSILPRFLAVTAIAVLFVISGCTSPTIQYPVLQTASLRIMNFAPNCTVPMDVYWAAGSLGTQVPKKAANVYNLQYGEASVYTTSIPVAASGTTYTVDVTQTRDTLKEDIGSGIPINLVPLGKYTIVVTLDPNNANSFISTTLTDAVQPAGSDPTKQTFVRFMNLQPNIGALSVHVNDPVTGDNITPTAEDFNKYSDYKALNTALDTSYAFYVTNSANQIIAKLSYQTFVAGNYYTLVYAGDLCNTPLDNPADTVNDASDTLRLRAFDDNGNGADQTNPPPQTYRFNIINALTPGAGVDVDHVGFTVNGADFPEFDNFSVPAIPVDYVGGTGVSLSSDNVINVNYQSGVIPPAPAVAVSVAAEALNGTTPLGQLFAASMTETPAGIAPNHSVSYLFFDTIVPTKLTAVSTRSLVFPVPDTSNPNAALILFVPAIGGGSTAQESVVFDYSVNGGAVTPFKWYSAKGAYAGLLAHTTTVYEVPISGSTPITVTDSLYGTGAVKIPLPSQTFTAQPGGIYEVVAMGNYKNLNATEKTIVIRVNGQ